MTEHWDKEVDSYYPPQHALAYYKFLLENLLKRVESVRAKITELEKK